jgi:hypothetical protein
MKLTIRTAVLRGVEAQSIGIAIDTIPHSSKRRVSVERPNNAHARELAVRVSCALERCGFGSSPVRARIDCAEQGSGYPHGAELAIAAASIVAGGGASTEGITGVLFYAGLSSTGRLEPLRGATAVALECRRLGISRLVVARENVSEAAIVSGTSVIGCETLADVVGVIDSASGLHQQTATATTPSSSWPLRKQSTSPRSGVFVVRSGRLKSPRRAATTFCWRALPALERRFSPEGSRRSCRRWRLTRSSRRRRSSPLRDSQWAGPSVAALSGRRITR